MRRGKGWEGRREMMWNFNRSIDLLRFVSTFDTSAGPAHSTHLCSRRLSVAHSSQLTIKRYTRLIEVLLNRMVRRGVLLYGVVAVPEIQLANRMELTLKLRLHRRSSTLKHGWMDFSFLTTSHQAALLPLPPVLFCSAMF